MLMYFLTHWTSLFCWFRLWCELSKNVAKPKKSPSNTETPKTRPIVHAESTSNERPLLIIPPPIEAAEPWKGNLGGEVAVVDPSDLIVSWGESNCWLRAEGVFSLGGGWREGIRLTFVGGQMGGCKKIFFY